MSKGYGTPYEFNGVIKSPELLAAIFDSEAGLRHIRMYMTVWRRGAEGAGVKVSARSRTPSGKLF